MGTSIKSKRTNKHRVSKHTKILLSPLLALLILGAGLFIRSKFDVFALDSVFDIQVEAKNTGSSPFDTATGTSSNSLTNEPTSGCESTNTADYGNDLSILDTCVRRGDTMIYSTRVSNNQQLQPGEKMQLVLTLHDDDTVNGTDRTQEWQSIPATCDSATSTIDANKQILTCYLPDNLDGPQGSFLIIDAAAYVKENATSQKNVWVGVSISTLGASVNTASALSETTEITAGFRMDLKKQFVAHEVGASPASPNDVNSWQNTDGNAGNGTEDLLVFSITGKLQKGSVLPSSGNFTITDTWKMISGTIDPLPTNSTLVGCGLMGDSATASYTGQFPYGKSGINPSATSTNSSQDSGSISCLVGTSSP
jgi:hypothetical protein